MVTPLGEIPDLLVAVGLPYERAYRQANSIFYRTMGGLALLTLVTLVSVLAAAELSVLSGLRALARTVRRFGKGELSARAAVPRGYGELAYLAGTFNTMASSLAARHQEAIEAQSRLRALSARLHVARETEAARIARELHDEIGQVLTSLKIDLSRLGSNCARDARTCAAALQEGIAVMSERIVGAIDFVRRISADLRPGVLDKLGLAAALEWQAREIEERSGLTVQVDVQELAEPIDWLVSVTMFRIAQEALTNVVRHAEANVVSIELAAGDGDIVLSVHDDGRGIGRAEVDSPGSLGVIGMRERAMLVDGNLSIQAAPGEGTTVSVRVPRHRGPGGTHAHPAG